MINNNEQIILMVTHDINAALRGNRIIYLDDGKIISELLLDKFRRLASCPCTPLMAPLAHPAASADVWISLQAERLRSCLANTENLNGL